MLIVLDTNVLVSALLKRNSAPGKIIDAILEGKLRIAVDKRIIDEYAVVLHRPRLNIPPEKADPVLGFLSQSAQWVDDPVVDFPKEKITDPGDLPFAEVAICGQAEALVTGNLKHFTFLQGFPLKVLLPQAFIKEYEQLLGSD